jgi:hypothetical protein
MHDLFAADDDDTADESLTKSIAEIFLRHGLALPAHVAVTINGGIILRPIREGNDVMRTCH